MNNQNDTNIIRMVDRSCMILEYIYQMDESASISKLAKELDLPKASIFRILYTMQQHGLIEKEAGTDMYKLGKELVKYGEKVKHDFNLIKLAKHMMKAIAQKIGETVNIGIENEGSVITLHSEEGEKSVLVSRLIPIADLYCSSMGKLVLAEMNQEKRKAYFQKHLSKRTINTLTSYDEFEKERSTILEEGLAYDCEEYEYGLSCIAAPIRDKNNHIIAMISVSGPTTRLEFKGMDNIIDALRKLAKQIENDIY